MVTLFLRQGETGKQVLLSFPVTTPAEKEDVTATMEKLRSISRTVTIQGAASEVMNLGQHLRGIDLAAEGELERINQLAERLGICRKSTATNLQGCWMQTRSPAQRTFCS